MKKTVIELCPVSHLRLRIKCATGTRIYVLLANGCIIRRPTEGFVETVIQIVCDVADARMLRDYARKVYPWAASEIITSGGLMRRKKRRARPLF